MLPFDMSVASSSVVFTIHAASCHETHTYTQSHVQLSYHIIVLNYTVLKAVDIQRAIQLQTNAYNYTIQLQCFEHSATIIRKRLLQDYIISQSQIL